MVGLKEETLLQALVEMENRLSALTEEVNWLKQCVKGKETLQSGLGLGCGQDLGAQDSWSWADAEGPMVLALLVS